MKRYLLSVFAVTAALFVAPSYAQEYPTRTITIEAPYDPGTSTDIMARMLADGLGKKFGQTVIVENHAGASGQIGLARVAKSKPDGYTLGVGQITNLALAPFVSAQMLYNPEADFAPVAAVAENYLAIISNNESPIKNARDLVAWAKGRKLPIKLGSPSSGGLPQMAVEMIASKNGFQLTNIPYKNIGSIVTDVASGQLDLGVSSYTSLAPAIKSGRVHLVGITIKDKNLPELQSIGEYIEGYSVPGWNGILAPAGTSDEIIKKLNAAINEILQQPEAQKRLTTLGLIPVTKTPQEFAELIKSDTARFAQLVKSIGFQPR
jgi:tripartite-type tricarboxylate transporter receptor subunit TctC